MRKISALLGIALLALAGAAHAEDAKPVRVGGRIASVDGNKVVLTAADGSSQTLMLTDKATVTAVVPATLADLKPGLYVGAGAEPDGAGRRAVEVHIFLPGTRPAEGHRGGWGSKAGGTMTNADLTAASVSSAHDGILTLTTGGQSYDVKVAPETVIVRMEPGSRALLAPGSWLSTFRAQPKDGVLTADAVSVRKEGPWPVQ